MSKYAAFFRALKTAERMSGHKIDRHQLVRDFTANRTSSLKDLSPTELYEITFFITGNVSTEKKLDTMRKKVISLLKFQGYTLDDGSADMPRIYSWVLKHGHLHKPLNAYGEADLPKLVYQAEQMKISFIDGI